MDSAWAVGSLALATFVTIVVILGLVIWSIRRHRDPDLKIECDVGIDELLPSLAGLSLGSVIDGNSVEVLENGKFWDVSSSASRRRATPVHYETFLWEKGKLGKRMAKAFSERAKAGVKIRILLDANGSKKIDPAEKEMMEKAGAKVIFFHDKKIHNIGVFNDRTHRKILIIDGKERSSAGIASSTRGSVTPRTTSTTAT
jgi:cardiolipin synthase